MIRRVFACGLGIVFLFAAAGFASTSASTQSSFRVLAFYTDKGEPDHIAFANQAIAFYSDLAKKEQFDFSATTDWNEMDAASLKNVQVVVWLNDFPHNATQRSAFEDYMSHGGAWLGFHVSAYNDESTGWPWFVNFLGGAIFYGNNWPPLPATLDVDDPSHPVVKGLPKTFTAPSNEWYIWKPSPRLNCGVKVLLTLDPKNYPIGLKDTITAGDLPVVWTNTKFHMIYMNMGHGDKIFTSPAQNKLFENAILWLGRKAN
ncbi:MAG: ThuA domain-containing protein [Candidatus Acidiferrales bacterium]